MATLGIRNRRPNLNFKENDTVVLFDGTVLQRVRRLSPHSVYWHGVCVLDQPGDVSRVGYLIRFHYAGVRPVALNQDGRPMAAYHVEEFRGRIMANTIPPIEASNMGDLYHKAAELGWEVYPFQG